MTPAPNRRRQVSTFAMQAHHLACDDPIQSGLKAPFALNAIKSVAARDVLWALPDLEENY